VSRHRVRVLVVDDDPAAGPALADAIRFWVNGSLVDAVPTASAAFARLEAFRYAAIVTDYRLPDVDGRELLRIVRARWPGMPAVLVSGDITLIAQSRADDMPYLFLPKPLDRDRFQDTVDRVLQMPLRTKKIDAQLRTMHRHCRSLRASHLARLTRKGLRPSGGVGTIGIGEDGAIFYWSPAARALYGWSPAEVIGRDVGQIVIGRSVVRHRNGGAITSFITDTALHDAQRRHIASVALSTPVVDSLAAVH